MVDLQHGQTEQGTQEDTLQEIIAERGLAETIAGALETGKATGKTQDEIKEEIREKLTDEQKEYIDSHKVTLSDDDKTAYPKPRASCPHCHGRGYEGWFVDGKVKICRWLTNMFAHEYNPDNLLTLGELNKILNAPKPVKRVKQMSKKKRHRLEVAVKKATGEIRTKGGARW